MKDLVLSEIMKTFEEWSNSQTELKLACQKGCSSCCTQNVTMTALEGENILRFIIKENKAEWFAQKLFSNRKHLPPQFTTNDFAKACLDEKDVDMEEQSSAEACPFLDKNLCMIYPVRPFSCRLFVSSSTCGKGKSAAVPNYYLEASTAVSQLIEHLGQKEYWGNMLDVLPALLDISEFSDIGEQCNKTLLMQSRMQTLTAKPLPGFLLSEGDGEKVVPLIETIFQSRVDGKTIEDILNGQ